MAFEWQDFFKHVYTRLTYEDGELRAPGVTLFVFGLHHTLSLLCIPMNLYYYDEYYYWCMIGSMQFAAAFAYITAEYTYLLNVKTSEGLQKMKWSNLIAFVILLFTRGFHYVWICYNLLLRYYKEESWNFFTYSLIIFIAFSFFNVLMVIVPFYQRTVKWYRKAWEHEKGVVQQVEAKKVE